MTTKILNLTQHKCTEDQKIAGVVDLDEEYYNKLCELLTFETIPTQDEMRNIAQTICYMVGINEWGFGKDRPQAMIGGAPFFMSTLEATLISWSVVPVYAFSKRQSIETYMADGTVKKTSVFLHGGFVTPNLKQLVNDYQLVV